ncbi:hypothetical protein LGH82_19115 [Mesorhizobium sp. PAMC28654]|uniref:hypothetical protein n=1 Tax=Mesorhizobium sp. PAMC28654 TaxID=2880934 RepID=UPI001D0BBFE4|nr:hypothetical protein [Mesorhizobium sp. PAMC28654]UDL87300.1 hypothetical protein LGH82_19115 [Mesorhizobium sp. PAMC28654]
MGAVILIVIGLAVVAMASANFKNQTGVDAPTRSALKGMRRRARKAGVSEEQYFNGWVERKRRRK